MSFGPSLSWKFWTNYKRLFYAGTFDVSRVQFGSLDTCLDCASVESCSVNLQCEKKELCIEKSSNIAINIRKI